MASQQRIGIVLAGIVLGAGIGSAHARDITVGMALEPPGLDPTAGAAAAIREVTYANIFEGLTRFSPEGEVEPALANDWDISEDGLEYVFHLQEGVEFHDGATMTAEDVKFTLDRARDDDSTNAQPQLFELIEDVEVIDDHTVRVTLSEPDSQFLFNMAWGDAVILSPDSAGTNTTEPVGTGPFTFERWAEGDRIELVRNEEYWGEPVALSGATFRFISDPSAAQAAMMAGDLDAYPNFPAPETLQQFEGDPRFDVMVGNTEGQTLLAMNHGHEALADIRVRQAIAHAVDRQDIIDGAMFGYGEPIGSHFSPHHPDYVDLTDMAPHDPERARELLAEAGYADGLELRLTLPPPSYARRGGEIIASQLREVGIDTESSNLEWAQWLEQVFTGRDFDLTVISHTEPMDIDIYARSDYYFGYDSAEFRDLIAEWRRELDPDARSELMADAQRHIAEDQVNAFLFQLAKAGVAKAEIDGLWEHAPVPANDLTGVSWPD